MFGRDVCLTALSSLCMCVMMYCFVCCDRLLPRVNRDGTRGFRAPEVLVRCPHQTLGTTSRDALMFRVQCVISLRCIYVYMCRVSPFPA